MFCLAAPSKKNRKISLLEKKTKQKKFKIIFEKMVRKKKEKTKIMWQHNHQIVCGLALHNSPLDITDHENKMNLKTTYNTLTTLCHVMLFAAKVNGYASILFSQKLD